MALTRVTIMKSALSAMHAMGVHTMLRPLSQGIGMILTLHRVRPAALLERELGHHPQFSPNALLEITPEFLDVALQSIKDQDLPIISMDEAVEVLKKSPGRKGRFVVLTFDDGYKDNRDHALPVLEAHNAPGLIYMPSDYPQGRGELWWVALEEIIRNASSIVRPDQPERGAEPTETSEQKLTLFLNYYWALRAMSQDGQRANIRDLAASQSYDLYDLCQRLILSTPELQSLNQHPLITIGAHTVTHRAIARLSPQEAMAEMVDGADWLEACLGARPAHFSFPYGDAGSAGPRDFALAQQAGFASAVTTRKGMLYPEHRGHMFGLPRVSMNGQYQEARYVELFASGAPFLLANRFRKVA